MTNNKFKLGDRVKDHEGNEGVVVDFALPQIKVYQPNFGNTLWYEPYQLTLIDAVDPEETANLSDDSVKEEPDPNDSDSGMEEIRRIQEMDRPNLYGRSKGFNPEKLTFDGRDIKEGDEVQVRNRTPLYSVELFNFGLGISKSDDNLHAVSLKSLNIVYHFPAKSELEEVITELEKSKRDIATKPMGFTVTDDQFDRYYQARKRYEELESK